MVGKEKFGRKEEKVDGERVLGEVENGSGYCLKLCWKRTRTGDETSTVGRQSRPVSEI